MFLSSEDIQEIRIFRSRLIRLTEHRLVCPDYLSEEIAQIVNGTLEVRNGRVELYRIDNAISPMVRYFLAREVDFEPENFITKHEISVQEINRLIELLNSI